MENNPQMPEMGEREFRELADNAPVMIWRSRPDKLCDWFNKPWCDFSGKTQEQLFGYGWAEDVHADDLDRCVSIYETAFDARESFTMPYRLRGADGSYRWFLDSGAPFYRNGVFAGYFGSCTDITEQRELEEHQQVLLAELNHRVKNNLQLILSFLQLSHLRSTTDEAKTLLDAAIKRVRGVGTIQDQLYKMPNGFVDLAEYLPGLARSVLDMEGNGKSVLSTETVSINVSYDLASNIGLIVNELITNAIKHGQMNAQRVRLILENVSDDSARIVVSDSGVGFSESSLTSSDGSHRYRGSGLIEALARRSNISIQRENQNGAVVVLTFHR